MKLLWVAAISLVAAGFEFSGIMIVSGRWVRPAPAAGATQADIMGLRNVAREEARPPRRGVVLA